MTISYNWLCDYLPVQIEPERLSKILTSIGLEVEHLEEYESVKGGLKGLVIGEVLECAPHPNADKLRVTRINTGGPEPLSIVCGASNVAAGQKVIVALPGTTIHPIKGEPITLKVARIRGVESHGMICAEDEIGLGESHEGIIVLPAEAKVGTPAAAWFKPYSDHVIEIGLTPNHMDAMSHWGVARDVCAWLSHHENKEYRPKLPSVNTFKPDNNSLPVAVSILNTRSCGRYSGVTMKGITIRESPQWMKDKLKAIGVRSINNIVDITNFVLHELGQPLHAFDLEAIKGRKIIVKNMPEGTPFVTLDEKERKLSAEDLVICNAEEGMAIAGVFGGLHSGITDTTRDIFLESAWFNPTDIRKTSFRHGLRTDAATHFEKGMDISGTVNALKRAALLVKELAGGEIASDIVDVYPDPANKVEVSLKYHYLKKLSGKNYHPDAVKNILSALGFEIIKEGIDVIHVAVPWHKPDISLPADLVEEIMRIDGLDNIVIPAAITISPSVENDSSQASWKSAVAHYLVGQGFNEILTNSITNSAYFSEQELETAVKMINNLSAELDILRPSLLETGLESVGYNLNRKNGQVRFFEFGKTYRTAGVGDYQETNHLCLYLTGPVLEDSWRGKGKEVDFYYVKGLCEKIFPLLGLNKPDWLAFQHPKLQTALTILQDGRTLLEAGSVKPELLKKFDCRQDVYFADFRWDTLLELALAKKIEFKELPRQLPVYRDLAMIVDQGLPFEQVEKAIRGVKLDKLQEVKLFDIFESEKLGKGKKSLAVSFTFLDEEKTLTDKEIDGMVGRIMGVLEKEVQAEIRK
ncbi:phenylalanine--tRNA ligase subunit beta [Puia dinghuensis]|uniref:Phenylalanine--tRNA ligase beta subunit n=1 Tax=Puia dinghuensis TaxID=1792502 RepID=A0A8J2UES0_9BACT|nr:phenylalanine--tRNA ligase subunit beta [Puia dinghuensis]GGB06592.1 phenylalanine--tRNA ligase beta subunit [Puia dinghuensis]